MVVEDVTCCDLTSVFKGRQGVIAEWSNAHPVPRYDVTDAQVDNLVKNRHLTGDNCYGFYLMREDSKVWVSCTDFDSHEGNKDPHCKAKAKTCYKMARELGLQCIVERSAGGEGWHIWLINSEPVDAAVVRNVWYSILHKAGLDAPEIYPRQDSLAQLKLGNLIRYPLWNQSEFTQSKFKRYSQEYLENWLVHNPPPERREPIYVSLDDYDDNDEDIECPELVKKLLSKKDTLLYRRWNGDQTGLEPGQESKRSSQVQSISNQLVRKFVPTSDIRQALRYWCDWNDYEKGKRRDFIDLTLSKSYGFVHSNLCDRNTDSGVTLCDAIVEAQQAGESFYYGTGIECLDAAIDGISAGEVFLVIGRPNCGKTLMALQWINEICLEGVSSLIITEEMTRLLLGRRMLNMLGDDINPVEYYKERSPVYISEFCRTIDRVEQVITEHVHQYDVKIVAIDYLQLLTAGLDSEYANLSEVSHRLKSLAGTLDIGIILLGQMNREVERRGKGSTPQLSDIRGSGAIEQDVDTIVALQFPHRQGIEGFREDEYFIHCLKRRNGPLREVKVHTTIDLVNQRIGGKPAFSAANIASEAVKKPVKQEVQVEQSEDF